MTSTRSLERVPRRSWLALAVAAIAYTIVSLTLTGTNIAFPAIVDAFAGSNRSTLSWALSGYSIALATFMVPAGRIADRRGRRRIFFAGTWVYLAASVLCAVAPTAWLFVGGRVLQGVGGAMTIPTSLALVLPDFPQSRRTSAVAVWTASGTAGAALAPSVAAWIVSTLGWRWVYVMAIPFVVAILIAGPRLLRESEPSDDQARLDFFGFPMGTTAIGIVAFIIVQIPLWGFSHPAIISAAIAALVLFPLFVIRSLRHPAPLLDLRIFRVRQMWTVSVANLIISMLGASTWVVWPLFLIDVWDYSLVKAGLAITPAPFCASVFAVLSGQIADRFGRWPLIAYGPLLFVAAMLTMVLRWTPEPAYLSAFLPGILLFGTGFGLTFSSLNAAALHGQGEAMFGEVNAGFNTIRNLAAGLGVAATIAILGEADPIPFANFDRFFFVFALFVAVPVIVINAFYPRPRRERGATGPTTTG